MLQLYIDAVRGRGEYQDVQPRRSFPHRPEDVALRVSNKVASLAPMAELLRLKRLAIDYEMAGARCQSSRRVLDGLDTLTRVESMPW